MPVFTSAQWVGPLGGLLCITFAAGCVAGWTFAMKLMSARINSMKAEIVSLKSKVERLDEFMFDGMKRQLGQVRVSTYRMMGDGEEREQGA